MEQAIRNKILELYNIISTAYNKVTKSFLFNHAVKIKKDFVRK